MAGGGSGVGDPRGSARARCPGLGPGLRPALYYSIFPCPGLRPARDERGFSRTRAGCANSAGARLAHQDVAIAARCCIKPIHKMLERCVATHRLFSALAKDAIGTGPGVGEKEGTLLRITAAGQSLHARFGGHRQVHQQRVAAEKHPGD